ncbi:MAG: PD40 domain-containing protein [Cyclobacteriaceae bacterium]|nr:PD40 domain-containing protein [Cyclobacteriaceae bacterium]
MLMGVVLIVACSPEKKARKSFRLGKYETVIDYYKGVARKQPNNGPANYYIAESYRLSNRIKESEPYYAKAGGKGVNPDSVKLYYAKSLQANAKYEEARQVLEELESTTADEKMKARAYRELDGINYLDKLAQKKSYYKIKNLEAINTPFTEYAPVYSNNELYFTSSRSNGRIYEATGTPFTDLYKAETNGANVNVNTIALLPGFINDSNVNEGCITFTPDGRTMIFAKGNTGKRKGASDVDLYLSRFRNGSWSEPTPININQPDAWESTPALSPDGRTLYFSSNRKGGFGGLDLYSAQMDGRGRFGRVRNLGPEINTAGSELFPYVSENGKLYFSSDGHPGYGMLDIFVVNRANGKTVVENLGQPVNSPADDFGIYLFKADRGFFTSNREGGKGDDDIYTFVNEDPNLKVVNYYLQGITYMVRKDSTREILPNTLVTLLDQEGEAMQDYVTGNDGKFLFRVYENEAYTLIGETDGYITKRQQYTTVGKSVPLESLKELVTNITLDTVLVLDRKERNKIFVLENIYFGYDSADIRRDAARELDKLVVLLNDNPDLRIEMGSHTDSVASDAYNIELSQRRAESTVNYLIRKGIDPARLVAKGYGESKPIARNTNPDGSDNPAGRQRNRRTEFKILEIGTYVKPGEDDEDKYFRNELKKNENEP